MEMGRTLTHLKIIVPPNNEQVIDHVGIVHEI